MRNSLLAVLLCSLASCTLLGIFPKSTMAPMVNEDALESAQLVMDALDRNENQLASDILRRMRGFHHDEATVLWIDGVEHVLQGRKLVEDLELSLFVREDTVDGVDERSLYMRAQTEGFADLELFMSPPTLKCLRSWIDPLGNGGSSEDSVAIEWLDSLVLTGGETAEFKIMRLEGGRGTAMALRESWSLQMRFCYLNQNDRNYLVNAPLVDGCDRYLLSSVVALGDLDAQPLLDSLRASKRPHVQQLIERVVRIPESRKAAAMDQVAQTLETLSLTRIELAAPALTWLAQGTGMVYHEPAYGLDLAAAGEQDLYIMNEGKLLMPRFLHHNARAWRSWGRAWLRLRLIKPKSDLDLPTSLGDAPANKSS